MTYISPREYQAMAAQTASGDHREERSILGYYGELHEYDDRASRNVKLGELGDRAWYLAEICTAHGLDLERVLDYPPTHHAQIAESRKKWLRGDYDRVEYLRRLCGGVSHAWELLQRDIRQAGLSLSEVLRANHDKLKSRKERGVIMGDGER